MKAPKGRFTIHPDSFAFGSSFQQVLETRDDVRLYAVNLENIAHDVQPDSTWLYAELSPGWGWKGFWWVCTTRVRTGIARVMPIPIPAAFVGVELAERLDVEAAEFRITAGESTDWNPWYPPNEIAATAREANRKVYFIQPLGGGLVKIGSSRNPEGRLQRMQTGSPVLLRLVGLMPGGTPAELELHERFAEHRVRGEWFRPAPELLELIAEHPYE